MDLSHSQEIMEQVIALANLGRITAPPNPWVGCFIIKDGKIVGKGFHAHPGSPHAEIVALEEAGDKAVGSTVYVSLEPCAHFGRTPPCTQALINAKVSHVVIALEDPDVRVRGQGIARLKAAGIKVSVGIGAAQATHSLAPYLWQRTHYIPYCLIKAAVSLDGRIAAMDGSSQWLSCESARENAHLLRAESQAIMVGAATAIKDRARLTVRNINHPLPKPPLRVVLDPKGKLPSDLPLFNVKEAPTLIITSPQVSKASKAAWLKKGAEVEEVAPEIDGSGLNLKEVLALLGKRGIIQLLVEGGGRLHGAFLRNRLVQQLTLYVSPLILGQKGIPLFNDLPISNISQALRTSAPQVKSIGSCVRLDYIFNTHG